VDDPRSELRNLTVGLSPNASWAGSAGRCPAQAAIYINSMFLPERSSAHVTDACRNGESHCLCQECAVSHARFTFSGETIPLRNGRVIVCGSRTSTGGRDKKHVFIEVECKPDEVDAVQKALAVILQRQWRIETAAF